MPLVIVPTPLSTLPVPLEKTPFNVVLVPDVIVDAPALKLVMVGAATTVTFLVPVAAVPAALVTLQERLKVPTAPALKVTALAVAPAVIVPPVMVQA